jgi:sulfite reductase (NADPH) flavoprotein alpha-component
MTALPIPSSIPLSEERGVLLARLTDGLDAAALHWLSGYAAGLATQQLRGTRALQVVPATEAFAAESPRVEGDSPNASRMRPNPPASRCGCCAPTPIRPVNSGTNAIWCS